MDFALSEDRRMLADTLERFVAQRYGFTVRERIARSADGFSRDLWRRFADLGAIGALFGEAHGGFGGDGFDVALVFEALGRGLVVEPFLDTLLVGRALAHAGSDAQRESIAQLIDGSRVAAFAHDEPGSHYDASRVTTRAERRGGRWVLNGAKGVVQHGEQADLLLVSARTSGGEYDEDGISLFLVRRDAGGVRVRGYPKIDGGRAAEVALDGVEAGAGALVGTEGDGFATLEHARGYGLVALSAEALGAMGVARDFTLAHLRTRKQFGVPIGSFQALQHRMVDLLIEIEQARSAVINAAAALGAPRREREHERALSAAKHSVGRIGAHVAEEAIQLHGGIGMTWELPLAHYAKRLVMIDHQLGDGDHHLERYIALGHAA